MTLKSPPPVLAPIVRQVETTWRVTLAKRA